MPTSDGATVESSGSSSSTKPSSTLQASAPEWTPTPPPPANRTPTPPLPRSPSLSVCSLDELLNSFPTTPPSPSIELEAFLTELHPALAGVGPKLASLGVYSKDILLRLSPAELKAILEHVAGSGLSMVQLVLVESRLIPLLSP